MFALNTSAAADQPNAYAQLAEHAQALFAGERNAIANAANLAALIWHGLPELNWAGFYFFDGIELVLGPFQGKPACVRITLGRGVCGSAANSGLTQIVDDVHRFPGHIACDAASKSEIVVPLLQAGTLIGVLDLDSPRTARFDRRDAEGLEALVRIWLEASDTAGLRRAA